MRTTLENLLDRRDLSREESRQLFERVIQGELSDVELSAVLVGLRTKGESPAEIAGAATALRARALSFPRPSYPFADCCGTGGDGAGTVNLSTAAGLVAAASGLPVVKHGNRAVSSACGSADVLEGCGVVLECAPEVSRRALDETGFCFLFAPQYHAGLRHAMGVRRALGTRTILNLLGPLVNPSAPPVQLMGVYDPRLVESVARTLGLLGASSALVVHCDGLDEIGLHAPTVAARLQGGEVELLELDPRDAGVGAAPTGALAGGGVPENAARLRELLSGGGPTSQRDAIAINAGALLFVSDRTASLADGTALALDVLASGEAARTLEAFAEVTRG